MSTQDATTATQVPVAREQGRDLLRGATASQASAGPSQADFTPWVAVYRGEAYRPVGAHKTDALGPILAVRHYLSQKQWRSLSDVESPEGPVLARFEVVEATNRDATKPTYAAIGSAPRGRMPQVRWDGFWVRAILYWVRFAPHRPYGLTGIGFLRLLPMRAGAHEGDPKLKAIEDRLERQLDGVPPSERAGEVEVGDPKVGYNYSSGEGLDRPTEVGWEGPQATRMRVETMDCVVVPRKSPSIVVREEVNGPAQWVIIGGEGWMVDEARSQAVSSRTVDLSQHPNELALYDVSLASLPSDGE